MKCITVLVVALYILRNSHLTDIDLNYYLILRNSKSDLCRSKPKEAQGILLF